MKEIDENIKVLDNNVEYYKNGNVKAYESTIHHVGLGKTIKVRNRDHQIYKEKLDEALELLYKEWEVVSTNDRKRFNYTKYLRVVDLSKVKIPNKYKDKELLLIPEKPLKNDSKYMFQLKWYHKLFYPFLYFFIKDSRLKFETDMKNYDDTIIKNKQIIKINATMKDTYKRRMIKSLIIILKIKLKVEIYNEELNNLVNRYKKSDKDNVIAYFSKFLPNRMSYNNLYKEITFEIDYNIEDSTLIVNFKFPKENEFPKFKKYKFIKAHKSIKELEFKKAERENLIKDAYYSLYIAIVNDIVQIDTEKIISYIVLNGIYSGVDSRTGKEFEACIMTSKVEAEEFRNINLDKIEPKDTFKYFSGKGVPDTNNISPVEPIRFIDKGKFKLIETDEILSNLSIDTNLAAMDWRDFETLIKDLFELEFRDQDIEIRNTQHSNDGGIDVVAFNNNPYTGGVILLQAKRYTNTVQPEPVRALKGSMDQHNAIRGILATTSKFGASSIEYARQHNITLIDGDKLVEMFKKHNYKFHIDLEQAKKSNIMG